MNLEDLCARLECEYLAIKEDWSVPIPRNPDGLEAAKHLRILSTENAALRQRVAELEGDDPYRDWTVDRLISAAKALHGRINGNRRDGGEIVISRGMAEAFNNFYAHLVNLTGYPPKEGEQHD